MNGGQVKFGALAAAAVFAVAAAACTPPPLPPREVAVEVLSGTVASVAIPFPELQLIVDAEAADPGHGLEVTPGPTIDSSTSSPAVGVDIAAALNASDAVVRVSGYGCLLPPTDEPGWTCPAEQRQGFDVAINVSVVVPGPEMVDGFPTPSPERWIPTADEQAVLPGEAEIIAAPGGSSDQLAELVRDLGGGMTGGDARFGVYQARFSDLPNALTALNGSPLVESAQQVQGEALMTTAVPVDWRDDDEAKTWTFTQVGAPQAWDRTTGSTSVHIGIIDSGIYNLHSDLQFAGYEAPFIGSPVLAWQGTSGHGTHVAGTMCSPDGNGGLVGVSQGCSLHALDLAGSGEGFGTWTARLSAIMDWYEAHPEIRVVNLSFQLYGPHQNFQDCTRDIGIQRTRPLREAFQSMDRVLWVAAAGNCGESGISANEILPASLHNELSNVVAVSATDRSSDGTRHIASYSANDGTIAAPGGSGASGVWSTSYESCSLTATPPCPSSWNTRAGTSMAAPMVSGAAGLMLSLNPGLSPAQLKSCLVEGATTPIADAQIAELSLPAALQCAAPVTNSNLQEFTPPELVVSANGRFAVVAPQSNSQLILKDLTTGEQTPIRGSESQQHVARPTNSGWVTYMGYNSGSEVRVWRPGQPDYQVISDTPLPFVVAGASEDVFFTDEDWEWDQETQSSIYRQTLSRYNLNDHTTLQLREDTWDRDVGNGSILPTYLVAASDDGVRLLSSACVAVGDGVPTPPWTGCNQWDNVRRNRADAVVINTQTGSLTLIPTSSRVPAGEAYVSPEGISGDGSTVVVREIVTNVSPGDGYPSYVMNVDAGTSREFAGPSGASCAMSWGLGGLSTDGRYAACWLQRRTQMELDQFGLLDLSTGQSVIFGDDVGSASWVAPDGNTVRFSSSTSSSVFDCDWCSWVWRR